LPCRRAGRGGRRRDQDRVGRDVHPVAAGDGPLDAPVLPLDGRRFRPPARRLRGKDAAMSTKMQVTHELAGDVDTVFALMTDPDFLQRKFDAGGAKDVHVEREDTSGGVRVVIRRKVTLDLPGFAAKFIQPTNTVVQTEDWAAAAGDGRRVCIYRVDVQGV